MKMICLFVLAPFAQAQPAPLEPVRRDPAAAVARMADNLERTADLRRQYVYEKLVGTAVWKRGARTIMRQESRQYVVTGVSGLLPVAESFQGNCTNAPRRLGTPPAGFQDESYTQPGFPCPGLERPTAAIANIAAGMVDDRQSLDAVPYWLLPLRPAYLDFFHFRFRRETTYKGRRTYLIDFRPARRVPRRLSPGDPYYAAHAWHGTLWLDAEELQPARLDCFSPRQELAAAPFRSISFGAVYQHVAPGVWIPTGFCSVLWSEAATAKVVFDSHGFRRADVSSQLEYVFSSIRFH